MPAPRPVRRATDEAIAYREGHLARVVARVAEHLGRLRDAVVGSLSGLSLTELQRSTQSLLTDLRQRSTTFGRTAAAEIVQAADEALLVGQAMVDEPLLAANLTVFAPDVTLPMLDSLLGFSADRVTGLSADLINQLSAEIRLGALGVKTPYEVIEAIVAKLKAAGAGSAGAGSLSARAESIVRTELGRIHSMASQRRLEQALVTQPDLMKEWRHSGNFINPRSGHQAVSGTRIPVAERFRVAATVGGTRESMLHPRDPAASARNVARCRCDVLPWLPSWDD